MKFYKAHGLPTTTSDSQPRALTPGLTTLERAFSLARSGGCDSVSEITQILRSEGYDQEHIEGESLKKQLKTLIQLAREQSA